MFIFFGPIISLTAPHGPASGSEEGSSYTLTNTHTKRGRNRTQTCACAHARTENTHPMNPSSTGALFDNSMPRAIHVPYPPGAPAGTSRPQHSETSHPAPDAAPDHPRKRPAQTTPLAGRRPHSCPTRPRPGATKAPRAPHRPPAPAPLTPPARRTPSSASCALAPLPRPPPHRGIRPSPGPLDAGQPGRPVGPAGRRAPPGGHR